MSTPTTTEVKPLAPPVHRMLANLIDATAITVLDCVLMYIFWIAGMAAGLLDASFSHWFEIASSTPLFLLDGLTVLAIPLVMLYLNSIDALPAATATFANLFFASAICVNWLYHSIFECSHMKGTPGKIFMELSVLDRNGGSISFLTATVRHFAKAFSTLTFSLPVFGRHKDRSVHDLISRVTIFAEAKEPAG